MSNAAKYLAAQGIPVRAGFPRGAAIPARRPKFIAAMMGFAGLGAYDGNVARVQTWLNRNTGSALAVDGIIGPQTNAALSATGWSYAEVLQKAIADGTTAAAPAHVQNVQTTPMLPPNFASPSLFAKVTTFVKNHKLPVFAVGGAVALLVVLKLTVGRRPASASVAGLRSRRRRRSRK